MFHSSKFNSAKLKYEIPDKDLLVILTAFKEWGHYLEASKFPMIIYTDHKNLEYFLIETRQLNRRQARWVEFMAKFNFNIVYRPGTAGGKPEALVRFAE